MRLSTYARAAGRPLALEVLASRAAALFWVILARIPRRSPFFGACSVASIPLNPTGEYTYSLLRGVG